PVGAPHEDARRHEVLERPLDEQRVALRDHEEAVDELQIGLVALEEVRDELSRALAVERLELDLEDVRVVGERFVEGGEGRVVVPPAGFVPSGEGFARGGAGAGAGPGAGAPPVTACGARGSGRPLAGGAAAGTRAPELVPTGGRAAGAGAGGIAPPLMRPDS